MVSLNITSTIETDGQTDMARSTRSVHTVKPERLVCVETDGSLRRNGRTDGQTNSLVLIVSDGQLGMAPDRQTDGQTDMG